MRESPFLWTVSTNFEEVRLTEPAKCSPLDCRYPRSCSDRDWSVKLHVVKRIQSSCTFLVRVVGRQQCTTLDTSSQQVSSLSKCRMLTCSSTSSLETQVQTKIEHLLPKLDADRNISLTGATCFLQAWGSHACSCSSRTSASSRCTTSPSESSSVPA